MHASVHIQDACVSRSQNNLLLFLRCYPHRVSHRPRTTQELSWLARNPRDPPVFTSPSLGLETHTMPGFFHMHSGDETRVPSNLSTELYLPASRTASVFDIVNDCVT